MRRDGMSRPIRLALLHEIISDDTTVFDYGCGHGDDITLGDARSLDGASGLRRHLHHRAGDR